MLIKATQAVCRQCKYHMKSNGGDGVMCNYAAITGHLRAFDDKGQIRLPQGYCDCFSRGKPTRTGWTSDDNTFVWQERRENE